MRKIKIGYRGKKASKGYICQDRRIGDIADIRPSIRMIETKKIKGSKE